MFGFNRNTKIFLIIISILVLISILAFFLMQKRALIATNQDTNQATQNTLPTSQSATSNQQNTASSSQTATNTAPSDSTASASPSGKETASSDILNQYGKYAFETFQKFPSIVRQLRALDSNFSPSQMYVSHPSRTYNLGNGKDYLALGGCTKHDCSGTTIIVLYSVTDNSIYLGKENSEQTQLQFFGDPTDEEKNTMTNFYLQK
jgi:hypothetical protein